MTSRNLTNLPKSRAVVPQTLSLGVADFFSNVLNAPARRYTIAMGDTDYSRPLVVLPGRRISAGSGHFPAPHV